MVVAEEAEDIQHQAAGEVLRLEGFEDRPDFQQGIDPGRADGDEVAVIVADPANTIVLWNPALGGITLVYVIAAWAVIIGIL